VYQECEIMFHVAPMLPWTENDEQQIQKKRHIGNDIVVIIYKEGNTPFSPDCIKSCFNRACHVGSLLDRMCWINRKSEWLIFADVFIVVSKDHEQPGNYRVGVACKAGVGKFGPHLPYPASFPREQLRDLLLCKRTFTLSA